MGVSDIPSNASTTYTDNNQSALERNTSKSIELVQDVGLAHKEAKLMQHIAIVEDEDSELQLEGSVNVVGNEEHVDAKVKSKVKPKFGVTEDNFGESSQSKDVDEGDEIPYALPVC